jgi:hypothetical protein
MKILCSVLHAKHGTLELQAEPPPTGPRAPIAVVLPGFQAWMTIGDACALRGVLQQAIDWAEQPGQDPTK